MTIVTRPTKKPEWATTGTITEPSSGKKASGWLNTGTDIPGAATVNWIHNLVYQWLEFMDFVAKRIAFSVSAPAGGVVIANLTLEDNSSAKIEVVAGGLISGGAGDGDYVHVNFNQTVFKKTTTVNVSSGPEKEIVGDSDNGDIEIVQNGNNIDIKLKSNTDTWLANGSVTIKPTGLITIN